MKEAFDDAALDEIDRQKAAAARHTMPTATRLVNPFDLYLQREEGSDAFFDGDFVSFNGQTGAWTRRKEPISATVPFLCNMRQIALGWVKLVDNKPVDRLTGFLIEGYQRPPREELPDREERHWPFNRQGKRDDPWRKTTYLPMRCTEDGDNVLFGPFADTQRKAIRSFIGIYRRSVRDGKDPVVLLENRSFVNQSGGTTYVPTFKIIGREYWDGAPAPDVQPVAVPTAPAATPAITKLAAPAAGKRDDTQDDMDDEVPF